MNYTEAIKDGFKVVNRNWQLVLIQTGLMLASLLGFLIFVGLPLAIAFIIFGIDLTALSRMNDVFQILNKPSELIARYLWLVIIILASVLIYITLLLALGIFVFGGAIGVMGRAIKDSSEVFHLKTFLSEGRRLFFPLIGFTALIGLIFIVLAFVIGIFGGTIAAIVSLAKEHGAALGLFLGIFFSLLLFVVGLVFILATLAVTIYGAASLSMKGLGAVKAIREAVRYLYKHVGAFYLYGMVFGGYVFLSFIILLLGYPLGFIPIIGPLLTFGYQFTVSIVQSYLGLAMIAVIFKYYYLSTTTLSISENSIQRSDISEPQVQVPEEFLPEKEVQG